VAFIFQHHYLLENFTVEENLTIFGKLLGKPNPEREVEEILNFLNLQHRRHHRPSSLSGGERQRVAIGRALISGAKLILADEPTGSLDEQKANEIFQYFKRINAERSITFLIVTHNTFLKKYFNKTYYILNGLISDKLPV
jgi:lipoprotein-releasing system ATP-binding protein